MKKILFVSLLILTITPLLSFAHTATSTEGSDTFHMMEHMTDNGFNTNYGWGGMMSSWGMHSWGWVIFSSLPIALSLIWLIVGILAIVWLWKKISSK